MSNTLALVCAASSGIGLSLAKELIVGYDLIVCFGRPTLDDSATNSEFFDVEVIEISAHLATCEAIDRLWQSIRGLGRPLDVVCLNAGVGVGELLWDADPGHDLSVVQLNCARTMNLAEHVVKHMRELSGEKIPSIASITSEMVATRESVHVATKAFVLSLSYSLGHDLMHDTGFDATVLSPFGMDDTKVVGTKGKSEGQQATREWINYL